MNCVKCIDIVELKKRVSQLRLCGGAKGANAKAESDERGREMEEGERKKGEATLPPSKVCLSCDVRS